MKHLSLLGIGFYGWNSYYDLFWVFIFELHTTWYQFCLDWHFMLLKWLVLNIIVLIATLLSFLQKKLDGHSTNSPGALYISLGAAGHLKWAIRLPGAPGDSHWGSNSSHKEAYAASFEESCREYYAESHAESYCYAECFAASYTEFTQWLQTITPVLQRAY